MRIITEKSLLDGYQNLNNGNYMSEVKGKVYPWSYRTETGTVCDRTRRDGQLAAYISINYPEPHAYIYVKSENSNHPALAKIEADEKAAYGK